MDVQQTRKERAAQLMAELRKVASEADLHRIGGLFAIWCGARAPECQPEQQAGLLFLPDLPTSPWLTPSRFDFAPALHAAFPRIKAELDDYLKNGRRFRIYTAALDDPYVRARWRKVVLCAWNRRRRACAYFPYTSQLIGVIRKSNRYLQQMSFLMLKAGTKLATHFDPFNYLLSVHLCMTPTPLAGYTVANESVGVREGQCVAFDNSYLHDAWNNGESDRIVLAIHTLHPSLTPIEMEILRQIHPILARPGRYGRAAAGRQREVRGRQSARR